MFVEQSITHKEVLPNGHGEYIYLKFRVGTDAANTSDTFENWSQDDRLPDAFLELIKEGAHRALENHAFEGVQVVLIEHGFLEVATPGWLFKYAAEVCISEALERLKTLAAASGS